MSFRDLLKEKLEEKNLKLDADLNKLPKGYQKIGDIIVLNLDEVFNDYKKEIGEATLEIFPKVRSICNKYGEIRGKFREPQIELLVGDENTIVTHIEHGCKYRFDIRKLMFAKGNLSERVRIPKQVRDGEIIVDMFAGLGYFSIPIGKLSKPGKLYSIELNPVSYKFLKENFEINKIKNAEAINGDNREIINGLVDEGVKADRVLMGYLPPPKEFLPWAFKIIKKNGILHYEDLVVKGKEDEEYERIMNDVRRAGREEGFENFELILPKKIKSYGPKIEHYVFDIKVS